jgi:hypothetical protein
MGICVSMCSKLLNLDTYESSEPAEVAHSSLLKTSAPSFLLYNNAEASAF